MTILVFPLENCVSTYACALCGRFKDMESAVGRSRISLSLCSKMNHFKWKTGNYGKCHSFTPCFPLVFLSTQFHVCSLHRSHARGKLANLMNGNCDKFIMHAAVTFGLAAAAMTP